MVDPTLYHRHQCARERRYGVIPLETYQIKGKLIPADIDNNKGGIMVISARLKSLSAKAVKAEVDMKIDEYERLVRKVRELCGQDPTEQILKDLRLTVTQSKVLANRIYELRHKN